MRQYLDALQQILDHGVRQKNRTGIDTFMVPGIMLSFDMADGFPAMTTKKLAFNAVKGELLGFIDAFDSAASFRAYGCNVWDQNANENEKWLANKYRQGPDHLGRIYGVQWRRWLAAEKLPGKDFALLNEVDQLARVIDMIQKDPTSRRIIMTAWNPGELDQMALPPCHLLVQFLVEQGTDTLHACMYQRSCDMFLGVPFNIASYALLLELVARATGKRAGKLNMMLADAHIYENHLEQVSEQLTRAPYKLPRLAINAGHGTLAPLSWLEGLKPEEIELHNYQHHAAIKAEMAV